MGGAALGEVYAGLGQAEVSVDGEAHFRGVEILLAVVFPPADGAESERIRGFQRPVAAAWTAKLSLHACMDGFSCPRDYVQESQHMYVVGSSVLGEEAKEECRLAKNNGEASLIWGFPF